MTFSLLVSANAWAQRSTPWGLENIAILTLPAKGASLERGPDKRSIVIYFETFTEELKQIVGRALTQTPLESRFHSSVQASMVVEVYSREFEVDFSARKNGKTQQVVIGEVKASHVLLELFLPGVPIRPLPAGMQTALQDGNLALADKIFSNAYAAEKPVSVLSLARFALIRATIDRAAELTCPVPAALETSEEREAAWLALQCEVALRRVATVRPMLEALLAAKLEPALAKRVAAFVTSVAWMKALDADRRGERLEAVAHVVSDSDVLFAILPPRFFVELVGNWLTPLGLGGLFARMAQDAMSAGSDRELAFLAPATAEGYLFAGDNVRASETANYYLDRKLPEWIKSRLLRVRGRTQMQDGGWAEAVVDLMEVKGHMGTWDFEDELWLIEAELSAGNPGAFMSARIKQLLNENVSLLEGWRDQWLSRLYGEAELLEGRVPRDEILAVQPTFVIYRAAKLAAESRRARDAKLLWSFGAKAKDGWGDLCRIGLETEGLASEFLKLKQQLEARE